MKIRSEHYAHMKNAIVELLAKTAVERDCSVAEVVAMHWRRVASVAKDADKRVRWDIARNAGLCPRWICDTLYGYLDDTHIDTALRRIMQEVVQEGCPSVS